MKATRREMAGVRFGWSVPTGDGFILRFDDGKIEWSWCYMTALGGETIISPRAALAEPRQRAAEERWYGPH